MGALGTWGMSVAYPEYFAASSPISGLWEGNVDTLINLPMWVFHGETDEIVPINKEKDSADEINKANAGNAHMANIPTYNNPEFYEWLFAQSK